MPEKWITTQEAAEISGYNVQHIRRLARGGFINSKKWGKEWMIDRVSVMEYLEKEGHGPQRKRKT